MEPEPKILEIDMRGQVCPSTLLTALREINAHREALTKGEVTLDFVIDNRAATQTIPDSAANMGYEARVTKEGDHYHVRIGRRSADAPF